MKNLITKEKFLDIFKNSNYRRKLDTAVTEFFGLEVKESDPASFNDQTDKILTINVLYECSLLFKIKLKDVHKIFTTSKNFYLNLTCLKKNRPFELIMPGFWNIYCQYKTKNISTEKKLVLVGYLFTTKNISDLKKILTNLNFNNNEINDIIDIVTMKK